MSENTPAVKSLALYRPSEFDEYAKADLLPDEYLALVAYAENNGNKTLSLDTAARFFELFLNGSSVQEIHSLNAAFPIGIILDAKVRFKWTEKRDTYNSELQYKVFDKVRKAQLETTELVADILVAAKKRYGNKLKKYIQSGNDEDLDGVLNVESLHSLLKTAEGLLKVTGQDRNSKHVHETKQTLAVTVGGPAVQGSENLTPDEAAQVLSIITNAKKRKASEPKN